MDGEDCETKKGKCVRIRRRCLVDREEKIKEKHRQTEPHQKQDFELLMNSAPTANDRPGNGGKDQRRVNGEVLAKKAQNLARVEGEPFFEAAARTQMRERDPGVL